MTTQLTPDQHDALDAAWAIYQRARRRAWVLAPHIERRWLRTADPVRRLDDHQHLNQIAAQALRGWHASVHKICGRRARAIPLGAAALGMPSCFLVRVPKGRDELVMLEIRMGRPPQGDEHGREYLAHERVEARKAREAATREDRITTAHAKMMAALTEARGCMATKAHALFSRLVHEPGDQDFESWTKLAYSAHARGARCMERAHRYKKRLALMGLVYDLATIETPVILSEEGAHDGSKTAASTTGTSG